MQGAGLPIDLGRLILGKMLKYSENMGPDINAVDPCFSKHLKFVT